MKRLRNHLIGVDQGNVVLFSDFQNDGEMWAGEGQRQMRTHVAFSEPFRAAPVVHLTMSMWDVSSETNNRADIAAEDVDQNGFAIVDKDPDYVVVGEGRTYTFEMLEHATNLVLSGARLIATNMDPSCPTSTGTRPGCGAVVKLLEEATGKPAFSVGKPSPIMMRAARKELGLDAAHTFMIGDTMSTDVLGGVQLGYHTILVLSGGTRREDLDSYSYQPDTVLNSVADLSPATFESLLHSDRAATTAVA